MFCHTMFILLGLCLSMIQTSSAHIHKYNKHVDLKTVKEDKEINQASLSSFYSMLGKANVKEFVRKNFHSTMTKSNFKEESLKKYTTKLSFLLSDVQLLYTEPSDPLSDIKPFGFQETLYLNTPVVDKYNKLVGEVGSSADCQVRNLTIPSPIGLLGDLGDGSNVFCQVSLTYTAKDLVNSSITFAFAVTGNSLVNSLASLLAEGYINKEFRSISADGVYFGKTFEVKVGVVPVTDDFKATFYVTEKKSEKSSLFDNSLGRSLSSKYYPVNFALNTSNSVAEDWLKQGITIPPSGGSADQYHTSYPFYDANGGFVGILLVTAHVQSSGVNRRLTAERERVLSPEEVLSQVIFTYVLNDAQASSISFLVAVQDIIVSTYRQLSFAADGVFSGKVFDITVTLNDNGDEYITFTEVKKSKSLSYSEVAEEIEVTRGLKKGADDYKQVVVTDPPFSVSWNTPPDEYLLFGFPGWDLFENPPNSSPQIIDARQATFYTTMVVTNQTTWEVIGYIIGVHACQPSFGGNGIDFTCQSTITYFANDLLDSSITFVTSLHALGAFGSGFFIVDTDKVVPSLSASGAFFGKTYNVRFLVFEQLRSVDLTFTEVRNGQVVTYKPTKQPVFKPTKKPISKKSNDKKSNDKQASGTLGSSSTGNEPSVGAIVGITVGAILLIGLLIGAYFWYMKKLQLKNTPVSLEENM